MRVECALHSWLQDAAMKRRDESGRKAYRARRQYRSSPATVQASRQRLQGKSWRLEADMDARCAFDLIAWLIQGGGARRLYY